jgi:D-arabinose 1-dehydrogenase-like Zn-dependent alcohol dehydrogenase
MQAAVFEVETGELRVEDAPVPEPGPGEVRVKVAFCGVCLSDVHLIDGTLAGSLPRIIPGHEASGMIDAVGSHVPGWQAGQRVVMTGGRPCGKCGPCIRGRSEECRAFEIMGFRFNGAWAEYVVVPYRSLCEVPDEIPLEQAAILADAVSTPYAALADRAQLRAGESIGLWGIGGLGTHAVQLARLLGAAPVIALDPLASARERALAVGADVALDPLSPDLRR